MENSRNKKKKNSEVNGDGNINGKKIKAEPEQTKGGVTADDDEVDEFFAILKRLKTGLNYLKNKGIEDCVGNSKVVSSTGSWNPVLELEDFSHVDEGGRKRRSKPVVWFDLNADPVTDGRLN